MAGLSRITRRVSRLFSAHIGLPLPPRLRPWAYQARLLLGPRALLYLVLVGFYFLFSILLTYSGISASGIYQGVLLLPALFLTITLTAAALGLEREHETLEFCLTLPRPARPLLQRLALVAAIVLGVECATALVTAVLYPFNVPVALLGSIVPLAAAAAITLYFATVFHRAHAAEVVAGILVALGGGFFFFSPLHDENWRTPGEHLLALAANHALLLGVAILAAGYAARRGLDPRKLIGD